jgi:hypothetical protein
MLGALGVTDLGERTINERAQSHQAAIEHASPASSDADVSGLENLKRDDRGVDQVSQFMGQKSETLVPADALSIERGLILSTPVLVTAFAMASSRHRFSVPKSSVLIGAPISTANSVIA